MAAAQLEKIAALADKLAPVARKSRGMPIEADDWNALVGVLQGLLEIDRLQEEKQQAALEDNFAPRNHEHLGQVTVAWLDPDLQAKLGAGSGSNTVLLSLAQLQSKVDSLGAAVAKLTDATEKQAVQFDRYALNDLDRAKSVREFETRFAGLENLKTLVGTVSTDVAGMRANIDKVLELRSTLTDATGAPIDVSKLRQDVNGLETLRDNLKSVDGSLVRVRDLELRLRELEDVSGLSGSGRLDSRIAEATSQAEKRLLENAAANSKTLKDSLTASANEAAQRLKAELTEATNSRVAQTELSLNTRISETETRLKADTTTRLAAATDTLRREQTDLTRSLVNEQLSGVPNQVKAGVTAARPEIEASLQSSLTQRLDTALEAKAQDVQARMLERVGTLETQLRTSQQGVESRFQGQIAELGTSLKEQVRTSVEAQGQQLQTSLMTAVTNRAKAEVATAGAALDSSLRQTINQQFQGLDSRIAQAATDATRDLPARITTELQRQLTDLDLNGKIAASETRVTQQFRAELLEGINKQQERSTTSVNAAITQLRGEIAVSVKAGTDDAVNRLNLKIGTVRDEFSASLDALKRDLRNQITSESQRLSRDFDTKFTGIEGRLPARPLNPDVIR